MGNTRDQVGKAGLFVAGGIFTGKDIAKYVKQGASGVQIGTR